MIRLVSGKEAVELLLCIGAAVLDRSVVAVLVVLLLLNVVAAVVMRGVSFEVLANVVCGEVVASDTDTQFSSLVSNTWPSLEKKNVMLITFNHRIHTS